MVFIPPFYFNNTIQIFFLQSRKRRVEWEIQEEEKKKAAAAKGEDYERVKYKDMSAMEADRRDRKKAKKARLCLTHLATERERMGWKRQPGKFPGCVGREREREETSLCSNLMSYG